MSLSSLSLSFLPSTDSEKVVELLELVWDGKPTQDPPSPSIAEVRERKRRRRRGETRRGGKAKEKGRGGRMGERPETRDGKEKRKRKIGGRGWETEDEEDEEEEREVVVVGGVGGRRAAVEILLTFKKIRGQAMKELNNLRHDHVRFLNPTPYKVNTSSFLSGLLAPPPSYLSLNSACRSRSPRTSSQ